MNQYTPIVLPQQIVASNMAAAKNKTTLPLCRLILLGIFADPVYCMMPYARGKQLILQAGGAYAVVVVAFVVTWLILLVISRMVSAYVAEEEEQRIGKKILEERKKMFGETEKG